MTKIQQITSKKFKRFLALGILVFFSMVSYGQARLGSTASDIRSEFWESHYKLKSGYTEERIYYISIETDRATVQYLFNTDKICTMVIIAPNNQGALNYYVELYNSQYVIVSSKEWKMYSDGGIANIKLVFADDGGYFFVWY